MCLTYHLQAIQLKLKIFNLDVLFDVVGVLVLVFVILFYVFGALLDAAGLVGGGGKDVFLSYMLINCCFYQSKTMSKKKISFQSLAQEVMAGKNIPKI